MVRFHLGIGQIQRLTKTAELRTAVQASLQAKVASLDEDKWMYEREDKIDPEA